MRAEMDRARFLVRDDLGAECAALAGVVFEFPEIVVRKFSHDASLGFFSPARGRLRLVFSPLPLAGEGRVRAVGVKRFVAELPKIEPSNQACPHPSPLPQAG